MIVILICFINGLMAIALLYLLRKILKLRKELQILNLKLDNINKNLSISLKKINLQILTIGLEIKKINSKYHRWLNYYKNIQKIILISKLVYNMSRRKMYLI